MHDIFKCTTKISFSIVSLLTEDYKRWLLTAVSGGKPCLWFLWLSSAMKTWTLLYVHVLKKSFLLI